MPADQGVRLNDGQCFPPGKQPGEEDQSQFRSGLGPTRLPISFYVQSQLLTEEEILRGQGTSWAEVGAGESDGIQP